MPMLPKPLPEWPGYLAAFALVASGTVALLTLILEIVSWIK